MIFAQTVTILDTELDARGEAPQRVLARMDLGSAEHLQTIPRSLGAWNMTRQHDWDKTADLLDTNVLLSRDYAHPHLLQTVNLLVIESTNVSSFHPAPVCYEAQGWTVPRDGGETVTVHVPNATWAQERWLSDAEPMSFSGNLTAKLLEVTKPADADGPAQKRVALYVYLKDEDWRVTKAVTWVRLEMAVPPDARAADVLPVLSDAFREVVPALFTLEAEEASLGESLLASYGVLGGLGMALAVALPLGLLWSPRP